MTTEATLQPIQTAENLNQQFGSEKINFVPVTPELVKAELSFSEHAKVEVHLQGTHLTRWLDEQGRDNIFNSTSAVYKPGVPIRGGNPIIFPQFGPGEIVQHGFARNSIWRVAGTETTSEATSICLVLTPRDIAETYQTQWPHNFVLSVKISLGESLTTQMTVQNPNTYPLSFTLGFHTYLAVDNISTVEIEGLSGLDYMDNLRERAVFHEDRDIITLSEFTDRRYQNIPQILHINDKSSGRALVMQTQNCQDAFVWNPWAEAEKKLSDLTPNAYQKFVCVEPGNMKSAIVLAAGQEFTAVQTIKRID